MKFHHLSLLVPAVATAALALAPNHATAETAYGLTSTSQLVRFDTSSPSNTTSLISALTPAAGQTIVGIDFQPSSLGTNLIALGFNPTTSFAQLYSVNLSTGALTTFGTGAQLGSGNFGGGTPSFGFDFNPSSGGIRITTGVASSTGQNNFRFGATGVFAAADTALAYAAGDSGAGSTANIVGAAYSNNNPGVGGTTTTLYGYDFNRDALVTIGGLNAGNGGPNGGILNTVATFSGLANTAAVGFDISGATGTGFLSAQNAAGQSILYSITGLGTATPGAFTAVGNFGAFNVTDFSVIPEPGSVALSAVGIGALAVAVRRRRKA